MLSIRSKLTVMFALMSMSILGPLCWVIAGMVERTMHRDGERLLQRSADFTAYSLLQQWDESFFITFGPTPDLFGYVVGASESWAAVRGDGTVLHRRGVFENGVDPVTGDEAPVVRAFDTSYRVLSKPLVAELPDPITLEDLPAPVRDTVYGAHPERRFLSASGEWEDGETTYEIESLTSTRMIKTAVLADGELLDEASAQLPIQIPESYIETHLGGLRGCSSESVTWDAYNGQLVAVWHGKDEQGNPCARGANRIGEGFEIGDDGRVVANERDSRIFIVVAREIESELAEIRGARQAILLGGLGAWLALCLVGWFVARVSMSPIRRLVDGVGDLGEDLGARIPERSTHDEVAEIQATVNEMLDRIEQGIDRERQFLANASHELRSPLAKLRGELDLALHQPRDNAAYASAIRNCASYVTRMQELVESLLILARLDSRALRARLQQNRMEPIDLSSATIDVLGAMEAERASRVSLEVSPSPRPYLVVAEEALLKICIRNLVDNALRYSPDDSPVNICLFSSNGHVVARVDDSGPGIPPEHRRRVLDRFYRIEQSRSAAGGGWGIGLSITQSICRAHGARLELESSESGGTSASLVFHSPN